MVSPINANLPVQAVKPVAKKQEEKIQQAMEQIPMFSVPVYMYPMQPIYMMPQQPMFVPQQFVSQHQQQNHVVTNPIKAEEPKVSVAEAMKAQALQPKVEVKSAEDKKEEKIQTKPEDVVLKAEQASFKGESTPVKEESKKLDVNNANKKPEIVAPEKLAPQLDMDALVELLSSKDYELQANAMEAVAQVAKLAPDRADELLDVKVVDTLIGVMSQDTSKVPEADRALAQRNKEYAMYTTAILQKVYQDGVKKVTKEDVPIQDVVGMAAIVNNLKNDENPETRKAALEALSYTKRPVDNEVMQYLFSEAANDIDPAVRARAEKELQENA